MIIAPSLSPPIHRLGKDRARRDAPAPTGCTSTSWTGVRAGTSPSARVVAAVRPHAKIFLRCPLMCGKPEILLEPFAQAGATNHRPCRTWREGAATALENPRARQEVALAVNPPTANHCGAARILKD